MDATAGTVDVIVPRSPPPSVDAAYESDEIRRFLWTRFADQRRDSRRGAVIMASCSAAAADASADPACDGFNGDPERRKERAGPRRRLEIEGVCYRAWDEQKQCAGVFAMARPIASGCVHTRR